MLFILCNTNSISDVTQIKQIAVKYITKIKTIYLPSTRRLAEIVDIFPKDNVQHLDRRPDVKAILFSNNTLQTLVLVPIPL